MKRVYIKRFSKQRKKILKHRFILCISAIIRGLIIVPGLYNAPHGIVFWSYVLLEYMAYYAHNKYSSKSLQPFTLNFWGSLLKRDYITATIQIATFFVFWMFVGSTTKFETQGVVFGVQFVGAWKPGWWWINVLAGLLLQNIRKLY